MRTGLIWTAVFIFAASLLSSEAFAQVPICVDPGHGGTDSGATGCDLKEADINLAVALKLEKMLKNAGFTVYMTRTTDTTVDLAARSAYANSKGVTTFASIHTNSAGANSTATGIETYCFRGCTDKTTTNNYLQASSIQSEMIGVWPLTNRGVKSANYSVLRNTIMPATLTELAFIGNCTKDAVYLSSDTHRQEAAEAHCRALVSKWGGNADKCTSSAVIDPPQHVGIVKGGTYKNRVSGEWLSGVQLQIGEHHTISSETPDTFWTLTVPEGSFTLTASKPGYQTITRTDCDPATATKISWCSVALPEITHEKGWVTGVITDSSNNAIMPAQLTISNGITVNYNVVDSWSFELEAGTYEITATAEGYNSKTTTCVITPNTATDCSLMLEPKNGTIVGRVYDVSTNLPISAEVFLDTQNQFASSTEEFVFSTQAGVYTLTAQAAGYETGSVSCQANRGQVSTCNIALSPQQANISKGFLKGQLLDARTGQPITGTVLLSDNSVFHYTGNAQYQFYLTPGIYEVTGMADGYEAQTVTCTVAEDQTTICDISLTPQMGMLTGYVYQAGDMMTRIRSTITVDGETLTYDGVQNWSKFVTPGVYEVFAQTKYGETGETTCIAEPGKLVSCNIAIIVKTSETRFGTLTGTVARNGMENMYIPATVHIDGLASVPYLGQDDELWTFENLPTGTYRVYAESPGYYENYSTCQVVADETTRCKIWLTPIINDNPDEPETPIEPDNPDNPNPPVNPVTPDPPVVPENPNTPLNPGNSAQHTQQAYSHNHIEEEACSAQPMRPVSRHTFGFMAILAGIGLGYGFRRRYSQGEKR